MDNTSIDDDRHCVRAKNEIPDALFAANMTVVYICSDVYEL